MNTIINILQTYAELWKMGLAAVLGIVGLFLLAGILRQIKRLNTNLKSVTANIQAYVDVILAEEDEPEEEGNRERNSEKSMERSVEKEEEIRAKIEELRKQEQDEQIFNAVLQEYFS